MKNRRVARVFEFPDATTEWVPRPFDCAHGRIFAHFTKGGCGTAGSFGFCAEGSRHSIPKRNLSHPAFTGTHPCGAEARIFSCLIAALKRRSSTATGMVLTLASLAGRTKASVPTQSFWRGKRVAHPFSSTTEGPPSLRCLQVGKVQQATPTSCPGQMRRRS